MDKKFILCLLIAGALIISGCMGTSYDTPPGPSSNPKKVKQVALKPEVGEVAPTFLRVTNRNDYAWHNVKITVNEYYPCWEMNLVESGEAINVNAGGDCGAEFVMNYDAIYSMTVEADEGSAGFSR